MQCLIKSMNSQRNIRAFTLVEILAASACAIILIAIVYNFYNVVKKIYTDQASSQVLENGANIILSKMIEGGTESTGVFRLSQASTYSITTGLDCNGVIATTQLHFLDTGPLGTDNNDRWYALNNTCDEVIYHHPTTDKPAGADEVIYKAPEGANIAFSFWIDSVFVAGIDIQLTHNNATGAAATLVNVRNHL